VDDASTVVVLADWYVGYEYTERDRYLRWLRYHLPAPGIEERYLSGFPNNGGHHEPVRFPLVRSWRRY
jgi:hypothetical protein